MKEYYHKLQSLEDSLRNKSERHISTLRYQRKWISSKIQKNSGHINQKKNVSSIPGHADPITIFPQLTLWM